MKKYIVSVCLLIKDEGKYLEEWLEWHKKIGIEHFYIYDNGSQIPVLNFIPISFINYVTIIDFSSPRKNIQQEAYFDCIKNFGKDNEWIAFIDTDEFIRIKNGGSIQDFLSEFIIEDAILVPWIIYNANEQVKSSNELVRNRFTQVANQFFPKDEPMHKAIVRMRRVTHMGAHSPIPTLCSLLITDEEHNDIRQIKKIPGNKIVIDHYFTRSYEEWVEKMGRGSCDPYYSRKYDLFFQLNPDLINNIKF